VSAPAQASIIANPFVRWFNATFLDLARQLRWSYVPPLMVYFAYGVSGLTGIVGTFFIKDYLGLSAAFLAGLTFWAGLPWAIKMPLGHLVDLIWRWKSLLIYAGAGLAGLSIAIMYGLIQHTAAMAAVMSVEAWFIVSALMAPAGYVLQDVVADAMTVEAVPTVDEAGRPLPEAEVKAMHTTMQTLGRFSIISALIIVAAVNIWIFSGIEAVPTAEKAALYADVYLYALGVPVVSVSGVVLAGLMRWRQARRLARRGLSRAEIEAILYRPAEEAEPNPWIFGGGLAFVAFSLAVGLGDVPYSQEIVLAGSMAIVLFLMSRLIREIDPEQARALVGTAVIIFVFRAVPLPGAGLTWFEIDVLGFDEQFLAVLSLITSGLALAGMVVLRPLMAKKSIAYIVVLLSLASGVLALPNIGLYYGIQDWTAAHTGGIVDARFIAIIDTAVESPLGQISMIPMLAWIARNAPAHLKATFFSVMASFTNLALSAASLATKYVNHVFLVSREVRDQATGTVLVEADYGALGWLLIAVAVIGLAAPLLAVVLVQHSRWQTQQ
jgi:hypothetical protein